jgi:hypothetical protein
VEDTVTEQFNHHFIFFSFSQVLFLMLGNFLRKKENIFVIPRFKSAIAG